MMIVHSFNVPLQWEYTIFYAYQHNVQRVKWLLTTNYGTFFSNGNYHKYNTLLWNINDVHHNGKNTTTNKISCGLSEHNFPLLFISLLHFFYKLMFFFIVFVFIFLWLIASNCSFIYIINEPFIKCCSGTWSFHKWSCRASRWTPKQHTQ